MTSIKNKFTLNIILIFSIVALGAAFFIQHILDHQPCNLCLIERIPYLASILLVLLLFFLKQYEKLILIIISIFFILGSIVSFYHFGIEQGFFNESFVCNLNKNDQISTVDDLLKELQRNTVSCKDVSFKFFGLSLATLNTIVSLFVSAILIKLVIKYEKN
jgi:disulfide bond formation protein DsbB